MYYFFFPIFYLINIIFVCFLKDSLLVIERYKSGFQPPDDFPFEDLSRPNSLENGSTQHMNSLPGVQKLEPGFTVKGTISAGKIKKRVGIFNIFGSNKVNIYILFINFL